jgi:soluble lytic murein transglycosylase-like protein
MADDPLAPFDPIFQAAGNAWNVDPLLLRAIAMQESSGNPREVSRAGAQGLMQIVPSTQKMLGVEDPFDPVQSIWGAAKYMDEALRTEGTPEKALLYYHGGPGWRGSIGPESRGYVPSVGKYYKQYLDAQQAAQPVQVAARDKE